MKRVCVNSPAHGGYEFNIILKCEAGNSQFTKDQFYHGIENEDSVLVVDDKNTDALITEKVAIAKNKPAADGNSDYSVGYRLEGLPALTSIPAIFSVIYQESSQGLTGNDLCGFMLTLKNKPILCRVSRNVQIDKSHSLAFITGIDDQGEFISQNPHVNSWAHVIPIDIYGNEIKQSDL